MSGSAGHGTALRKFDWRPRWRAPFSCPADGSRGLSWPRRSDPGWITHSSYAASSGGAENGSALANAGRPATTFAGFPQPDDGVRSAFGHRTAADPIRRPPHESLEATPPLVSTTIIRSPPSARDAAPPVVLAPLPPRRPLESRRLSRLSSRRRHSSLGSSTTNGQRSMTSRRTPCIYRAELVWKPIRVSATG